MATVQIELEGIDNASGVIRGVGGALSGLGDIAGGAVAVAIGNVLTPAIEGAIGAFGDMFSSALENEKLQTRLAQVIKSTGGAAGVTVDEANALAQQFTHLAGGSDDAILSITTLGLRAGTISEEQFPQFIQTSLDLGTVLGSTEQAATLLARAGDDVSGAVGRAERAGIFFTDQQKEQIKTLQESGDTAAALEIFMNRVAEATGGAAAANAETLAGKWETFKGRLSEAGEAIGTAVLPMVTQLFDAVSPLIPIIEKLANSFAALITTGNLENLDNIMSLIAQGLGLFGFNAKEVEGFLFDLSAQIGNVIGILQSLGQFFLVVVEDGDVMNDWLSHLPEPMRGVVQAAGEVMVAFQESMPMIQAAVQQMVDFVIGQVNILSPTLIANISSTLNSLAEFWREHGDTIMAVVSLAFQFITVTVGGALTLLSGIVGAAMALLNGDWTEAWQIIENTVETFMNSVLSIVGTDLETFIATWTGVFDLAKLIITTTFENIVSTVQGAIGSIVGAIQGALDWISNLIDRIGSLGNLSLPDWLTPGSATPFELGLRGIGEALETLSVRQIPQFAMAMGSVSSTSVFNIDARGSVLSQAQMELVVRRVLAEAGSRSDVRRRMG